MIRQRRFSEPVTKRNRVMTPEKFRVEVVKRIAQPGWQTGDAKSRGSNACIRVMSTAASTQQMPQWIFISDYFILDSN